MKVALDASLSCPPTSLIPEAHQSDHNTPARNVGHQTTIPFSRAASATPPLQPQEFPILSLLSPGKRNETPTLDPEIIVRLICDPGKSIIQEQQMDTAPLRSPASSIKRGLSLGTNQRVKYKPIPFAVKRPKVIGIPPGNLRPAPASITGGSGCDNVVIDTRIDSDTRTRPRLPTRLSGAEERAQSALSCTVRRFKPLKVHQKFENKSTEAHESSEGKQFERSPSKAKVTRSNPYP